MHHIQLNVGVTPAGTRSVPGPLYHVRLSSILARLCVCLDANLTVGYGEYPIPKKVSKPPEQLIPIRMSLNVVPKVVLEDVLYYFRRGDDQLTWASIKHGLGDE